MIAHGGSGEQRPHVGVVVVPVAGQAEPSGEHLGMLGGSAESALQMAAAGDGGLPGWSA